MKLRSGAATKRPPSVNKISEDRVATRASLEKAKEPKTKQGRWYKNVRENDNERYKLIQKSNMLRMRKLRYEQQNDEEKVERNRELSRKRMQKYRATVDKKYNKRTTYNIKETTIKEMSEAERKSYDAARSKMYRDRLKLKKQNRMTVEFANFLQHIETNDVEIEGPRQDNIPSVPTQSPQNDMLSVSTQSPLDDMPAVPTQSQQDDIPAVPTQSQQDDIPAVPTQSRQDDIPSVSSQIKTAVFRKTPLSSRLRQRICRMKKLLPKDAKEAAAVLSRLKININSDLNQEASPTQEHSDMAIAKNILHCMNKTSFSMSRQNRYNLVMKMRRERVLKNFSANAISRLSGLPYRFITKAKQGTLQFKMARRVAPVTHGLQNALSKFFKSHWVARALPSKMQKPRKDNEKEHEKYVLEHTLFECYQIWKVHAHDFIDSPCSNSCGCKISFSTFYRAKPMVVRSINKKDFAQCLCEQCLNVHLIMDSINRSVCRLAKNDDSLMSAKSTSINQLITETMCTDPWKIQCADRKCDACGVGALKERFKVLDPYLDEPITYSQYTKTEAVIPRKVTEDGKAKTVLNTQIKYDFVEKTIPMREIIDKLLVAIELHAIHLFTAHWQQNQVRILLKEIPENQVVMIVDYSQNISVANRLEPQSAYYNKTCFTLFPVVAYYNQASSATTPRVVVREEINIISNDLSHNVGQTEKYINEAANHIKKSQTVEKFILVSDRAAQQFSNGTMASNTSTNKREHHFFGSRHGKNASDTAGANLKTWLTHEILRSSHNITDLESLCGVLQKMPQPPSPNKRTLIKVEWNEIDHETQRFTMPGIKSVHAMKGHTSNDSGTLLVRRFSCFCSQCLEDNFDECENTQTCGEYTWKKVSKTKMTENSILEANDKPTVSKTKTTANSIPKTNEESIKPIVMRSELLNEENLPDVVARIAPVDLGNYVAVCLKSTKHVNVFMAKVVNKLNTEVEVSYMVKGFGGTYLWPAKEERSWEANEQVLVLNEPTKVSKRGHFMFCSEDFNRAREHFKQYDQLNFN